jgi:glycerol-3-phosphate dehydrogenase
MPVLERDPEGSASRNYDAIIIGGGIHGVMLSWTLAVSGIRTLLLERDDFGGATTANSLRIVHGGLRYLQTLDLPRFFESVAERRWFLRNFGELVSPLPCLMPLSGRGISRGSVLAVALALNDLLSITRNHGVAATNHLSRGRLLRSAEVADACAGIELAAAGGGALWYDAALQDSSRLLIEILRGAAERGSVVLNYVEATSLIVHEGRVAGVVGRDHVAGRHLEFQAPVVVNVAGPECAATLHQLTGVYTEVPHMLAWNLLLDRRPPCETALAIRARSGHTYFLHPWKGRLLLGTGEAAWSDPCPNPLPEVLVQSTLDEVNVAAPGLNLESKEILRVYPGLLPTKKPHTRLLLKRPRIVDHGSRFPGLHSVIGIKLTTARRVAEVVADRLFADRVRPRSPAQFSLSGATTAMRDWTLDWSPEPGSEQWLEPLKELIHDESVCHLDDLLFRRTAIGDNPHRALRLAAEVSDLFSWDAATRELEIGRVRRMCT